MPEVAAGFARRGARFSDRGLYNRIEGFFVRIRTQFCVKNSSTGVKFFPDEGADTPIWRHP